MGTLPCPSCGYDLAGAPENAGSVRCPECGESHFKPSLGLRQLSLRAWLIALVFGVGTSFSVFPLCLIALMVPSLKASADAYAWAILVICATFFFVLGPAIATALAYRFRIRAGEGDPQRWTSRIWFSVLLTGIDCFCLNLCLMMTLGLVIQIIMLFRR